MDQRESPYTNKFPTTTSSSRQWSTYKNPRIIRASNALGGKDRHSKVVTIRGLRDRRIRLSETTAIQLYDLQHRLGLGQPSKVVDWLIDAVKEEIDKLPPLPRFHQPNEPLLLPIHQENNSITSDQDYPGLMGFVPQNLQIWDHSRNFLSLSQFGGGFSLAPTRQLEDDHHRHQTNVVSHAMMIPSFPSYNFDQISIDRNDQSRHLISSATMRTLGFNVKNVSQASDTEDLKKSTELIEDD